VFNTPRDILLSVQDLKKRVHAHRRWLVPGLSLALTIVTLYFVFRGIDHRIFARLLATQDRSLLVSAAFFILLQIGLSGERWRAILSAITRARPPSVLSVQAVFYSSIFFNCLPLGNVGGDVARVWLARKFELSIGQIVLSVLLDRMLTVGALIVLAVVTLPNIAHRLAVTAWFGSAAILVLGAAGFLLLRPVERMLGRWRDQRLMHLLLRTAEELRYLAQGGGLRALVWALSSATCAALAAYCIARSLGMGVGLVAMIAVMSIVTFVAALPISAAGWGVREISVVALLGLLGIDREAALLLSVEFGTIATLMSLPGGVIWLTMREHRQVGVPTE
jgi:glycosyltransferase 2 family protein